MYLSDLLCKFFCNLHNNLVCQLSMGYMISPCVAVAHLCRAQIRLACVLYSQKESLTHVGSQHHRHLQLHSRSGRGSGCVNCFLFLASGEASSCVMRQACFWGLFAQSLIHSRLKKTRRFQVLLTEPAAHHRSHVVQQKSVVWGKYRIITVAVE